MFEVADRIHEALRGLTEAKDIETWLRGTFPEAISIEVIEEPLGVFVKMDLWGKLYEIVC